MTPAALAMAGTGGWLNAVHERLPATFILWGGLISLSIALIVLMRTRWAQSRPVACCVVLSVFAHVLLFSYAYGTRLIMAVPVVENAEPIPVELVEEFQPDEPDPEHEHETSAAPWDELVGEEGYQPKTSSPPAFAESTLSHPSDRDVQTPSDISPTNTELVARTPASEPVRPQPNSIEPLPISPLSQPFSAAALTRPMLTMGHRLEQADHVSQVTIDRPSSLLSEPHVTNEPERPSNDLEINPSVQFLAESLFDPKFGQALAGPERLDPNHVKRSAAGVRPNTSAASHSYQAPENPTSASARAESKKTGPQGSALIEQLISQPRTRLGDGRPVPQPFRLRRADHRLDIALARGGSAETEAAVRASLRWLANNQLSNGGWDADLHNGGQETAVLGHERGGAGAEADMGITGLALLAFLSSGHTHQEGDYREVVADGLSFLLSKQADDGNLYGEARLFARMYCHGMALFALSEAYGMTGDHSLRAAVQDGLQYTVTAQHPSSGGWRYQPGDDGDMSQFGWQVMAIKSAALAGVTVPRETTANMHAFLNSCCRGSYNGLASYRPREKISPTMTAEALVCRLLLENSTRSELIREAQGEIANGAFLSAIDSDNGDSNIDASGDDSTVVAVDGVSSERSQKKLNLYFLYYGTLGMFLAQDEAWMTWNDYLKNELLPTQVLDGHDAGSWAPDTVWGGYGGRVYSTAMATLCLEVYYRYLPLYQVTPDGQTNRETARLPLGDFRLPR